MAGYIGSKTVNLSTTGADIAGDANIDGDLTVDTNTLHVDSTNNRVGIGTSPNRNLVVNSGSSSGYIQLANTNSGTGSSNGLEIKLDSGGAEADIINRENGRIGFWTNNTERMRLDASGSLLVGKTVVNNDDNGLLVQPNGNSWFTATGNYPLGINRKTSDGALITFTKDQGTVGSIGYDDTSSATHKRTYIGYGDTGLAFIPTLNEIVGHNTSTNAANSGITLGDQNVPFESLYLSGGVYLGGTGSANKISDYEEGIFTPTLVGTGTAGVRGSGSIQRGKYTKVGNIVHFQLYIDAVSWSTAPTGNIRIRNLPFSSSSATASETTGSVMHNQYNFSYTTLVYFMASNVNELRLYSLGDDVGWIQASISNEAMNFYITGSYITDA